MFLNIPEAYMRTILVLSHNKCMTWWNVLESSITCESRWRFRLYSALPWLEGGNEFTWHNRGIKKCREDLGKLYVHFNFLSPSRWLFVLSVTSLFYESDNEWEVSLVEGMRKHRKTMRNKCPEQTLQVKIQYCIQLRSSLTTMVLILLSLFSCNYNYSSYMQMYATMFGWAMYQMMDSNKTQIVRAKEEKLAS